MTNWRDSQLPSLPYPKVDPAVAGGSLPQPATSSLIVPRWSSALIAGEIVESGPLPDSARRNRTGPIGVGKGVRSRSGSERDLRSGRLSDVSI